MEIAWKEFKPSVLFLGKFIGLYLILNLLYGVYVESYYPHPDPVTEVVSSQSSWLLQFLPGSKGVAVAPAHRAVSLMDPEGKVILSIFEGCNGLNVMIIFLSFVLSFGKPNLKLLWFIPAGLLGIHFMNLGRIILLYFVAIKMPHFLYFTHKYLFTAVLYGFVFLLWFVWVRLLTKKKAA